MEIRSRTYWNVYLVDKSLAEETGRPCLLPYRRSSIPMPSVNETDELESWPPLPMSSALVPQSVRHVSPRRGHVMSCFLWSLRVAVLYEDILGLDIQTVGRNGEASDGGDGTGWEEQYERWKFSRGEDVEGLAAQLDHWRRALPRYLEVDMDPNISPLPQSVIMLAVSMVGMAAPRGMRRKTLR